MNQPIQDRPKYKDRLIFIYADFYDLYRIAMQLKKYHQETIILKLRMYPLHHLPSEREINSASYSKYYHLCSHSSLLSIMSSSCLFCSGVALSMEFAAFVVIYGSDFSLSTMLIRLFLEV